MDFSAEQLTVPVYGAAWHSDVLVAVTEIPFICAARACVHIQHKLRSVPQVADAPRGQHAVATRPSSQFSSPANLNSN